jgi:hypothetical protein
MALIWCSEYFVLVLEPNDKAEDENENDDEDDWVAALPCVSWLLSLTNGLSRNDSVQPRMNANEREQGKPVALLRTSCCALTNR